MRKTIIHVNDDSAFLAYCRQILEKDGYEVQSFFGTHKALGYIETMSTLPELLILDGKMPQMDGVEFLRLLKSKLPNLFETTIVLGFSSFPKDSPLANEFRSLGAYFEQKPDTGAGLVAIIHRYLKNRSSPN